MIFLDEKIPPFQEKKECANFKHFVCCISELKVVRLKTRSHLKEESFRALDQAFNLVEIACVKIIEL